MESRVKEIARILQTSEREIQKMCKNGLIEATKNDKGHWQISNAAYNEIKEDFDF